MSESPKRHKSLSLTLTIGGRRVTKSFGRGYDLWCWWNKHRGRGEGTPATKSGTDENQA